MIFQHNLENDSDPYSYSIPILFGDTTTLADPTVVAKLKEQYEEE